MKPEARDPRMMPRRSSNRRLAPVSSKARDPMKRLMVKPTPHRVAAPYSEPQFIPLGRVVSFNLAAAQQMLKMPTCLPTNNPMAMPMETL